MEESVTARMDVIAQRNKKRPFAKIPDGDKARSLMISWLCAASKRFSPNKWIISLADEDRQLVKVALGTTPKNIVETLTQYNRDYFLAGAKGRTVYRLAKKADPVYVKQTLVYTRTPNANGAYSLTRVERTRAESHLEGDWEPATRMRGRGLANTWKTTDGQLCVIPQEYQSILLKQVDVVAPPDRFTILCALTTYMAHTRIHHSHANRWTKVRVARAVQSQIVLFTRTDHFNAIVNHVEVSIFAHLGSE